MFAKGPVNKVKSAETSVSCDSDSDVEITPKVKKGTIQSFFSQVQRSESKELNRTESETCDIVGIELDKVKKEKKSIASFFKSKLIETTDDNQHKDYEDKKTNDLPIERLSSTLDVDNCKKTIDQNRIDSFLTPKGNSICNTESVVEVSSNDKQGTAGFYIVDSDSPTNSDDDNDFELQRQNGMPVSTDGIDTQTKDLVNQLSSITRGKLTSDENQATCDKSENVSLKSEGPVLKTMFENNTNKNQTTSTSAVQNFAPEDYLPCEKCGKPFAVWDMPEHMDFHFAMDLQKDINAVTSQVLSSNTGKRKSVGSDNRGSKKTKISPSQGKLDAFFSRKT